MKHHCMDHCFEHLIYKFYQANLKHLISATVYFSDLVFNNKFINDNGVLILEHNGNFTFKDHNKWEFDKKYGSNYFSFFKKKAGNKPDSV